MNRVSGLGRPLVKMSKFWETLPRRIIKHHHLVHESSSMGVADECVGTSYVWTDAGTRELIANFPIRFFTCKMMSVLQPASLHAGGNEEVCSFEPAANLIPAEVECFLSSGSEGEEAAVNAYIEQNFGNLSRSGLEQAADMGEGAMSQIFGDQKFSCAALPKCPRKNKMVCGVDVGASGPSEVGFPQTSTPVKSVLQSYSQRKSSLSELIEEES